MYVCLYISYGIALFFSEYILGFGVSPGEFMDEVAPPSKGQGMAQSPGLKHVVLLRNRLARKIKHVMSVCTGALRFICADVCDTCG